MVLFYDGGKLQNALTRGNGYIGNDITPNIKTIRSVPLSIPYNGKVAVRGEIFIKKDDFKEFNEKYASGIYSNPRNLASGSVRRVKSSETALFPLNLFVYDAHFYTNDQINNNIDSLIFLKDNHLPLNNQIGFFSDDMVISQLPFDKAVGGNLKDIKEYIEEFKKIRDELPYEIDGLVIKINDFALREELGLTQHHPRWAIAFKFDAPLAQTKVLSIVTQVGRAGRITPVANLEPVKLSGSVISRATLHNQDYIDMVGVNSGDIVTISKRGDVIPAVEEVIEKGNYQSPYQIELVCPSCNSQLIKDGAHLFCQNTECPKKRVATLQYFVGRDQMDIETLGDKTIEFLFEEGLIRSISDIYEVDYNRLSQFEGYKDKKIDNIFTSVKKSKSKPFETVLASLGLKDIGSKVSLLLAKHFGDIDNLIEVSSKKETSSFTSIEGIGDSIANSIIKHFTDQDTLKLISRLKIAGLNFVYIDNQKSNEEDLFLKGSKWVITGSFENFKPRDKAATLIKEYGGEIIDAVSAKTNYLLCGKEAGSKLDKAKSLGITIIDEANFLKIIKEKKIDSFKE